jgi:hypothetical protein
MQPNRHHLFSFLAGTALTVLCVLTMSQKTPAGVVWEYRILTNPDEKEINALAEDGWDYAGYLGQSTRGPSIDETLWRRPKK